MTDHNTGRSYIEQMPEKELKSTKDHYRKRNLFSRIFRKAIKRTEGNKVNIKIDSLDGEENKHGE